MKKKIASFFIYFLFFCLINIIGFFLFGNGKTAESKSSIEKRTHNNEILIKYKRQKEIKLIKAENDRDFFEILSKCNNNPLVDYVEPNYLYWASIIPSDTHYNYQWYLEKIKAVEAWDQVRESPGIVIAIIDSGVQIEHPDLKDNIWRNLKEIPDNNIDDDKNGFIDDVNGWDFVNDIADPSPKFLGDFTSDGILHGTVVAGVAAASGNNAAGISGVSWRTQIMPLKALDDKGEGNTKDVVRAVDYAIRNGADIINLSFVGFGYSLNFEEAIRRAYQAGIIIVAAAGNELQDGQGYHLDETPMYPVCYDGKEGENMVVGVAATDALDQKAIFSSYGLKCVDIVAPGVSIFSTVVYSPDKHINGKYFNKYYNGYWSGTSLAAPMVSAAAALVEAGNPAFSGKEAINALMSGADDISRLNLDYLGQLGHGRLNVYNAVTVAKSALNIQKKNLLVAPYKNYSSQISIVNDLGEANETFFAYNKNFRGGVNVASGDVNGDGIDEIITGAGFTGGPHVRIFDAEGNLLGQFFAYNKSFRGGVNVASGDINGDGIDEIITGAGFTGGPQVRIFNGDSRLQGQFFAYDPDFRGGVKITTAKIGSGARGGQAKIITAPGKGGGAHIKIFNNHAGVLGQFFAYSKKFKGGVSLASADIDNDGIDEIITGAGPGGGPHVRVFKNDGTLLSSFYAFEDNFSGGVNVGAIGI